MTRSLSLDSARGSHYWLLLLVAASTLLGPLAVHAQGRMDATTLKRELDQRFDVLPIRDGVVLRPKAVGPIRAIEIAGGAVAIDGQTVTGAELRTRLGAEADLVLQLSYLDDLQRQALFSAGAGSPTAAPSAPDAVVPPAPPAPPSPPESPAITPPAAPETSQSRRRSRRSRSDDRVRFGGSETVEEGETVAGDLVVFGGKADVKGTVLGDVVVVGGTLELGPRADVSGDAVVVGGTLRRDPGARVAGEVQELAVGPLNINWRGPGRGLSDWWGRGPFGPAFSLLATIVRVGVLCLLAALVVLFARDYTERVGARAVAEPVKAAAVGLLAQLLFFPVLLITVVLFAITIIGIPLLFLLPFAILGLFVFALAGFTAVASHVGRLVTGRFGWTQYGPIATTVIGVVTLAAPVILGRLVGVGGGPFWILSFGLLLVGFLSEYLALTVGIGAVALSRFSRGFTNGGTVTGPIGPTTGGPLGPTATDSISPA